MKHSLFLAIAAITSAALYSQSTIYYSDPQTVFKEAKEYFQKEQYILVP